MTTSNTVCTYATPAQFPPTPAGEKPSTQPSVLPLHIDTKGNTYTIRRDEMNRDPRNPAVCSFPEPGFCVKPTESPVPKSVIYTETGTFKEIRSKGKIYLDLQMEKYSIVGISGQPTPNEDDFALSSVDRSYVDTSGNTHKLSCILPEQPSDVFTSSYSVFFGCAPKEDRVRVATKRCE